MIVNRIFENIWLRSGIVAAGLGYVYMIDPNKSSAYPGCISYALTDYHCPGCGLLRSTHALLHGDLAGALHQNVIVTLSWAVVAVATVVWSIYRLRGIHLKTPSFIWRPQFAFGTLAVLTVFSVIRNLPGFEMIAPY